MQQTSRCHLLAILLLIQCIIFNLFGSAYLFVKGCPVSFSSSPYHTSKIRSYKNLEFSRLHCRQDDSDASDGLLGKYISGLARIPLPAKRKSLFSRITFNWVNDLLKLGNKHSHDNPLNIKDLWRLDDRDLMGNVSHRFDDYYRREIEESLHSSATSNPPSNILQEYWSYPVTRAIVKMYKRDFIVSGLLKVANTCVQFFPSIFIARILHQASQGSSNPVLLLSLSSHYARKGVLLSSLLLLVLTAKTILENAYFSAVINLAASVRGALSTAIYRKSLRLNPQGRQNFTTGEISNYLQLDTNRLEQVAGSIHTVWDGILQITGYTCLLLAFLGPSVFAGILALVMIIPLNAFFLHRLSTLRSINFHHTDHRVKLTNEILQGIRAIKSYNWELPFLQQISNIRDAEIKSMKISANTRAILVSILNATPSLVAVITLSLYALLGNVLTPAKVFTALALFNQLRFPVIFLPLLLNTLADGKISLQRISSFLSSSELQNYVHKLPTSSESTCSIEVINGSFAWSAPEPAPMKSNHTSNDRCVLRDVNMRIQPGELVAIIGPVGAGKSMMMSALLGELSLLQGNVTVKGRIAYVPQSSWIPNDSLRQVILFGRPYNQIRYINAIRSCGLIRDLTNLEDGDFTEIGERGVNLSGGQKQRVSIARAIYDDADIYFLDDPLSALDADVGQQVFERCIQGVLKNKTRLLVTHQLRVLPHVDRIIVMNATADGRGCEVIDQGSWQELCMRGYDLAQLVKGQVLEVPSSTITAVATIDVTDIGSVPIDTSLSAIDTIICNHDEEVKLASDVVPSTGAMMDNDASSINELPKQQPPSSSVENTLRRRMPGSSLPIPNTNPNIISNRIFTRASALATAISKQQLPPANSQLPSSTASPKKLMTAEERGEGAVGWSVYRRYILSARSSMLIICMFLSFALANAAQIGQQWIVSAWTSDNYNRRHPLAVYLAGMGISAVMVALFNWSRTLFAYIIGANASKRLHYDMTRSVLRAPLTFFESTPVGRLMQRFSKDLDAMDQQLPGAFGQLVASALNIFGSMVAVCVATPNFAFVMLPVFVVYFSVTNYYRSVARELKRLESISRSPVYAHLGESISGLSVIQAYRRQHIFQRINEVKLDDNMSAYYALKATDRWLSVRLEFLGNIIVFFAGLLAVLSGSKAGVAGISLNNALSITSLLNWAVRNGAETESLMNSVERVLYIATETPAEQQRHHLPSISSASYGDSQHHDSHPNGDDYQQKLFALGWPYHGDIIFQDVKMKYRDGFDAVLKGVSMHIHAGERIGIVGRSGSGKSSLFRALLRLTEIQPSSTSTSTSQDDSVVDSIMIDGVDIRSVDLDVLRSGVSVIPQDPVLFSGSLRFNLDPFQQRSDAELWEALHKANLASTVASLPKGLYHEVAEGGENFSAGQRQLICLARAMVRQSKLLLFDEATSSVDIDTDALIQTAIRSEFQRTNATVLTIAHRLDTIEDADRILVMDNGRVAEFDTPAALLKNSSSIFAQLVAVEEGMIPTHYHNNKDNVRKASMLASEYQNATQSKTSTSIELNDDAKQSTIISLAHDDNDITVIGSNH